MADNEINTVHVLIRRFLYEIDGILGDKDKCQKWLVSFAKTLQFQDLCNEPNEYAVFLLREARDFCATQKRNSQIKQVRRILKEEGFSSPSKEQIDARLKVMYGQDELTAGAPNGNNGDESATACENMRRVPQNEDPSHGFSGGDRPAQGSMSLPPSGAAHDGNNLGSARPSTEGATRKGALNITDSRKRDTLEYGTSVDNDLGSAKTHSVCNTGSVQPVTRRESGKIKTGGTAFSPLSVDVSYQPAPPASNRLAGGMLPSSSLKPSASPGAVDVLNLAYSGEFGNVRLTQEQYAQLEIKFGNQQKLNRAIDSLSCKLENGESNPPNHYAELVKWANYRDDMEENEQLKAASQPHYETVSEHNARIVRESDKWIDEHFPPKRKAANG